MDNVKIKRRQRPGRPYHHGDLRRALVAATEQIIMERGIAGFSLREAARRAGVSPAAPAHHFKDAKGLLTETALAGFREFGAALEAADRRGGTDPARRLHEQAAAYVRFALQHPARFQLMFRAELHEAKNAEFARAAGESYAVLERAVRAAAGIAPTGDLGPDAQGLLVAVWSMVHGFAHLALDGGLPGPVGGASGQDALLGQLLPLALRYLPTASRS